MVEPSITPYFKLGCQIIVLLGFLIIDRRISKGKTVATLTACWLVVLLLYPYAVTVWHPRLSNQAAWLQMQHENLTRLGGDIGTGSEFAGAPLKGQVYPVDPPNRFAVFNLPQCLPVRVRDGEAHRSLRLARLYGGILPVQPPRLVSGLAGRL